MGGGLERAEGAHAFFGGVGDVGVGGRDDLEAEARWDRGWWASRLIGRVWREGGKEAVVRVHLKAGEEIIVEVVLGTWCDDLYNGRLKWLSVARSQCLV